MPLPRRKRCAGSKHAATASRSLVPAVLTMLGVCGIRIAWVKFVFPQSMTFQTIMTVYPVSLGATALLICIAAFLYRPSKRFAALERATENDA